LLHCASGTIIFASDDVLQNINASEPSPAHPRQDLVRREEKGRELSHDAEVWQGS
jgi:hypothetical protein